MLRIILVIIVLSLIAIFFSSQIQFALNYLWKGYHFISLKLGFVFAGGAIGTLIRRTLALIAIPLTVTLVPAMVYSLITRKKLERLPDILLFAWVMIATTVILHPSTPIL